MQRLKNLRFQGPQSGPATAAPGLHKTVQPGGRMPFLFSGQLLVMWLITKDISGSVTVHLCSCHQRNSTRKDVVFTTLQHILICCKKFFFNFYDECSCG
ncbi:Pheromone-processing carboxypeptidase KEX1 [Trichinella pseudospiralis]